MAFVTAHDLKTPFSSRRKIEACRCVHLDDGRRLHGLQRPNPDGARLQMLPGRAAAKANTARAAKIAGNKTESADSESPQQNADNTDNIRNLAGWFIFTRD